MLKGIYSRLMTECRPGKAEGPLRSGSKAVFNVDDICGKGFDGEDEGGGGVV